jgi:hypothetical protein
MDEVRLLEFETKAHDAWMSPGHREALLLAGL